MTSTGAQQITTDCTHAHAHTCTHVHTHTHKHTRTNHIKSTLLIQGDSRHVINHNRKITYFTIMTHHFGLIRSGKAHLTCCHMMVTIGGSAYWTPWYSTSIQFTAHCYTQQQTFPFLWVPELSLAWDTSFQQQHLATTVPRYLSNSLIFILSIHSTDWLIPSSLCCL
jgi:hypothetical protein